MSDTAVNVHGLSVAFRRGESWVTAVEDVALEVGHGSVLGIVGETGAGKTLTVKAVMGLLPTNVRATAGEIRVAAHAPRPVSDERAARELLGRELSVVLQNPAGMFDPVMKVGSQLVEGVAVSGVLERKAAATRAVQLLTRVGFEDAQAVMDLYPHELSGGMAQRAAIALALMPQPALIIADEPTSALDANLRVDVLKLLRQTALEEDAAVLLVSHDLALVSRFCDAVAVMYAGRVIETGPAAAVLHEPRHPYTEKLLATSARLTSAPRRPLPVIEGTAPPPGHWPEGCRFRPRCPIAIDVCETRPALEPVEGRLAACHRAHERGSATIDGSAATWAT